MNMAQTRYIHFRVTNEQFNTIKRNADLEGFKTVSNFLRELALHQNPDIQQKIRQIWETTSKTYELLEKMMKKSG